MIIASGSGDHGCPMLGRWPLRIVVMTIARPTCDHARPPSARPWTSHTFQTMNTNPLLRMHRLHLGVLCASLGLAPLVLIALCRSSGRQGAAVSCTSWCLGKLGVCINAVCFRIWIELVSGDGLDSQIGLDVDLGFGPRIISNAPLCL